MNTPAHLCLLMTIQIPVNQIELNLFASVLNLPKVASEIITFRIKEKNLLTPVTKAKFYCTREQKIGYHILLKRRILFCNDASGILQQMVLKIVPTQWLASLHRYQQKIFEVFCFITVINTDLNVLYFRWFKKKDAQIFLR